MKVKDHDNYDPEFPERFAWEWVDSILLDNITSVLINHIKSDLHKQRDYIPGLRLALNTIAKYAETHI